MIIRDYKCLDKDGRDPFKNDRKLIDQEQLKLLRFYKYGMYMDEWHFVLTSEEGCIPAPTPVPTPVPTITPVPTPTPVPTEFRSNALIIIISITRLWILYRRLYYTFDW